MNGTIFDLIEKDIPEGREGYFELAKNAPQPKEKSFLNDISDYAKTFLKGSVEGISKLGRMFGPLQEDLSTQQQLQQQTEALNKLLPTDEGFTQSALRRGLKEAPSMLAFPGSTVGTLPRSIAAGFLGEGAKELGAPEWAQTAAELTAFLTPDVTKKLLEKGGNKEIVQAGRKLGLSDEAITPLIQSEFKQKWLSKISSKRGATEKALETSKKELGETYSAIQKSPEAKKALNTEKSLKFIDQTENLLAEMPSGVRSKIREDLKDLYKKDFTGDSLINFWKDINHEIGATSKELSLLKKPIKEALNGISPKLGKDFETVNELFTKYYPISSKLKPTLTSDIVSAAEVIGILGAFHWGSYPSLLAIATEKAGKKVAQQLLINPRFQQLNRKMVDALNQNKYGLAAKLSENFKNEIRKISPETAEKMKDFKPEDFEKLLNRHQRKEKQ